MADRPSVRYLLMRARALSGEDTLSSWTQLRLDGCTLGINLGFMATGMDLPILRLSVDLAAPTVRFDLPAGDSAGIIRITGDPEQTMSVIPLDFPGSWARIEPDIRAQVFETRPAPQFTFLVESPEDRLSPAPALLGAIRDYRTEVCAQSIS